MLERVLRILQRPIFGTKVIPPDARVDPAQFSEDEFPVCCMKCEYLLRGLPDGQCPECGEPFERGRLLVLQYAGWRVDRQLRINKTFNRLSTIGLVLILVAGAADYYFTWLVSGFVANPKTGPPTLQPLIDRWVGVEFALIAVQAVILIALGSVGVVLVIRYWRRSSKRRRVFAAIQLLDAQAWAARSEPAARNKS